MTWPYHCFGVGAIMVAEFLFSELSKFSDDHVGWASCVWWCGSAHFHESSEVSVGLGGMSIESDSDENG